MDKAELIRKTYAMFRPPPNDTVSEWADKNRVLVSDSSAAGAGCFPSSVWT